ncbi:MAG: peptidylprolyl isomerase [Phycisphaerales bacterium]|nr:peptidylprolyl isomerase [Phycisphaerales bacterium]
MSTIVIAGLSVVIAMSSTASTAHEATQPKDEKPRVVALVGERALTWSDLGPELAEAAGAQVLEEHALKLILEETCRKRGVSISAEAIKAERRLLAELLSASADVAPDDAERLIASVRASRGLGEKRFASLLERNAALRAIVRKDAPVVITEEDIETAYALKFGERFRARLILVPTLAQAQQAMARLNAGESFADVAAQVSIDPSSSRGGTLDPFSPSDARYPVAVRRALGALKDGANSPPIAVTWGESTTPASGFAIVRREGTTLPAGTVPTKEDAKPALEREIRTVRERAQMDKLARELLRGSGISAMDPSLNWSWTRRTAQE